jgi:hypothetical protein
VNQEPQVKSNRAPKTYKDRQVGYAPPPDLSAMTKEEVEARRDTVGRLTELVKRAEKGNKKAVPDIREILRDNPDLVWRFMDLGKLAERNFIERMSNEKDLASRETFTRQLADMRAEIAGDSPSPLERLLAERIVATWLQIQLFEGLYAVSMSKSLTIAQAGYHQKRLDWSYKRHLSAIRTLAQIRKMGPAVQINVAQQQINTAGRETPTTAR